MTVRNVTTEEGCRLLVELINSQPIPFRVTIREGADRSIEQNKLQFKWFNEINDQIGDRLNQPLPYKSPENVRAWCKLHLAVPMLRGEDPEFKEAYDRVVKPLPYPSKLAAMIEPLNLPVTSRMNTGQMARYMDAIYQHFSEVGCELTKPERKAP